MFQYTNDLLQSEVERVSEGTSKEVQQVVQERRCISVIGVKCAAVGVPHRFTLGTRRLLPAVEAL